ncbi:MAG: RluA family pseudouridine synthase [Clostridia bacterium]|nr:RluA family pseudouridine synthase [Clostridia bacterium]
MRTLEYVIPSEYDGKKVLYFLKGKAGLSSRMIRSLKLVENGFLLNGEHTRTIEILHEGDRLTVNIPEDEMDEGLTEYDGADFGDLEILYEDDDIIAVNKPPMLAVHPTHNHQGDTLANLIAGYLQSKGKKAKFRAVGRLDKGTSGIVICALNAFAAYRLQGNIEKTYYALTEGVYEGEGSIDAPIYRPDPIKSVRTVDERGDFALTHYTALGSGTLPDGTEASFLKINIETGRTHQIRVHFAHLGTPLIGDTMYGKKRDDICHQALHCGHAELLQPFTNCKIILDAPLPQDITEIICNIYKYEEN